MNAQDLEQKIQALILDDETQNKKGIYPYLLTGKEKHLNLRAFSDKQKLAAYQRQKGICTKCKQKFEFDEMEGDHIEPWSQGGKTTDENCQMLCKACNREKADK